MAQEQFGPALEAYDEAARELRGTGRATQPWPRPPRAGPRRTSEGSVPRRGRPRRIARTRGRTPTTTSASRTHEKGTRFPNRKSTSKPPPISERRPTRSKRALRVRPGDRNAAWNLEYAMKRIREEEEKQEQQEQEQESENESEDEGENEPGDQDQHESQDQERGPGPGRERGARTRTRARARTRARTRTRASRSSNNRSRSHAMTSSAFSTP